jgi:hypothetical protein
MARLCVSKEMCHQLVHLTWAVGITAGLMIATLGMVVSLSYQLGRISGELAVLIGHVQLK